MMTTLQIVLAIVGVVLIGAIVLYNLIQERSFRRDADRMFSHRRDDIMLGESVRSGSGEDNIKPRISFGDNEPSGPEVAYALEEAEAEYPPLNQQREKSPGLAEATMVEPAEVDTAEIPVEIIVEGEEEPLREVVEPTVEQAVLQAAPSPVKPVSVPMSSAPVFSPSISTKDVDEVEHGAKTSGLDADTEYVARIRFATPSAANFGPLLTTLRRIGKPVRAFGKRLDGIWEPLTSHPRSSFDQVEIGLQLADRSGAVTHDQLDTFCRALYGFSAEEGGAVSCPDKQDALQAAKALDMLCMEVDVLIGLNVISSDSRTFTSEAIHKHTEEARLLLEADGSYHARDAFGHSLFTLTNQEEHPFPADGRGLTVHGVTLLFDVPRVADGLAVFDRMTRFGFDLAWRLEGRLVDDSGRAVTEDNLNRDRARLASFYGRMEARGIPAGGERALRLFV